MNKNLIVVLVVALKCTSIKCIEVQRIPKDDLAFHESDDDQSHSSLVSTDDLDFSETEYRGYLPPHPGYPPKDCNPCNQIPWIPIAGRSLHLPDSSGAVFHTNDRHQGFDLFHPPLDHYGAPQGAYGVPQPGQVTEFMLPPPFFKLKKQHLGPLEGVKTSPVPFKNFGHQSFYNALSLDPVPPPLPPANSQHFQHSTQPSSVPSIDSLPLSHDNFPPAVPSDSYGNPVQHLPTSVPTAHDSAGAFSDSYGYAVTGPYAEPIILRGKHSRYNGHIKATRYREGVTDIKILPSVRIADYTASVEHPVSLIQSPILDLVTKEDAHTSYQESKSSEKSGNNPIPESYETLKDGTSKIFKLRETPVPFHAKDSQTSESIFNNTFKEVDTPSDIRTHNEKYFSSEFSGSRPNVNAFKDLNDKLLEHANQISELKNLLFEAEKVKASSQVIKPLPEYPSWQPSSTMEIPTTPWAPSFNEKKSKRLQIIVPYYNGSKNKWTGSKKVLYNKEYTTLSPVISPPPMTTQESAWMKYVEKEHKEAPTTKVYNIKDFLVSQESSGYTPHSLPYDVISLQKNIDEWTHQSYSNSRQHIQDSKIIPQTFFSSSSHEPIPNVTDDHQAESSYLSHSISGEIVSNLIDSEETTTPPMLSEQSTLPSVRYIIKQDTPPLWNTSHVIRSNSSNEKVYVVTPQIRKVVSTTPATGFSMAPKVENGKVNNVSKMTRISVRVEPQEKSVNGSTLSNSLKVVFSEWPHLINNLETTTTTTPRPTSRHPLFGLMDLSSYTPPPNSSVETIDGHSKVVSVVTPSNVLHQ